MLFIAFSFLCWSQIHNIHSADITRCNNGMIEARENASFYATCYSHYPLFEDDDSIQWQIRPWRDQQTLDLVCGARYGNCTSHPEVNADFRFDFAQLHISKVERSMFNSSTLFCIVEAFSYGRNENVSCLIDVTYRADIESCQLQVHKENWTVKGFCDISKVYSSAGNYNCSVRQTYNMTYYQGISETVATNLTSFTDTASGLVYYTGQIQFSFLLPSDVGNVTYSVVVTPGSKREEINQTLVIVPPGDPELTNCEQHFILEGGNSPDSPCVCSVTSLGSPDGRLVWWSGDTILLSGGYGVTRLLLPYEIIDRTHNRQMVKCQVDWVVSRHSTNFTAEVAYGPDTAVIFMQPPLNCDGENNMTLLCSTGQIQPTSALLVVWDGLCQGQRGPTCTLTTPLHEHDGKNVTCTATNQMVPWQQAMATWTVKLYSCGSPQQTKASSSLAEGVGIGVGVTVAVVLVVVAILMALLWKRRLLPAACSCCEPTYETTSKRGKKESDDQHTYTDLSHYEVVGGSSSSQSGPSATPDNRTTTADSPTAVYVNTGADIAT